MRTITLFILLLAVSLSARAHDFTFDSIASIEHIDVKGLAPLPTDVEANSTFDTEKPRKKVALRE